MARVMRTLVFTIHNPRDGRQRRSTAPYGPIRMLRRRC
jgi:hypothetical protein